MAPSSREPHRISEEKKKEVSFVRDSWKFFSNALSNLGDINRNILAAVQVKAEGAELGSVPSAFCAWASCRCRDGSLEHDNLQDEPRACSIRRKPLTFFLGQKHVQ